MTMHRILTLLFVISLSSSVMAQTTTYRDNPGRKTGTATTDSRGVTTYRDELGRKTGTSETNSRGETVYRDELGQQSSLT